MDEVEANAFSEKSEQNGVGNIRRNTGGRVAQVGQLELIVASSVHDPLSTMLLSSASVAIGKDN